MWLLLVFVMSLIVFSFTFLKKRNFIDWLVDKNKDINNMSLLITSGDGEILLEKNKGEMGLDKRFALASVSKLFTHALVFKLIDDGVLSYDNTLNDFFADEELLDLHFYKNKQNAGSITVRHLLDQSSGFPDYETEKLDGKILLSEVIKSDLTISYSDVIRSTKKLKPHFLPGARDRAYYSNLNAVLLGKIAEMVTGDKLENLFKIHIFSPLNLKNTVVAKDTDENYTPIYYKQKPIKRSKYIASSVASGGLLSNNRELMVFTRAFFDGRLFNIEHIVKNNFNKIQWFPVKYGSGMMCVETSRLLSPLVPAPKLIGHSGSAGSFAFYCPEKDVFVTGTINQLQTQPFPFIYMYINTL